MYDVQRELIANEIVSLAGRWWLVTSEAVTCVRASVVTSWRSEGGKRWR